MDEKVVAEVLAAHAEHLVHGDRMEEEYLALFPEYQEELAPLLELARQTKETLAQVQPSEAFRNRLRQELLTSAQEAAEARPEERPRWRQAWVIGAAAAGSVISVASAVGVIAYRRRSKETKPAAAAG